MTDPEWSDFKVVLALGRGGSIAGAARLLGVDGSTVSRRLAAAEAAMGAVLIVRGGRAFAFTAEGRAALAAAEAMEAAVTGAAAAARAARTDLQGVVRIGCPPSALHFLMPLQKIVAEAHPGLGVELLSGRSPVDLAKGEADISIRSARPTDLDLVVRHSFEWGTGVYASGSYLEGNGWPAEHADLTQHRLVRYHPNFLHLRAFAWIEQFADPAGPAMRADSVYLARSLIAAGEGIGVLFCTLGDMNAGLVRVFPAPIDQMTCWIVYHESARRSARNRAVLDLLVAFYVEHRHALSGDRPPEERARKRAHPSAAGAA